MKFNCKNMTKLQFTLSQTFRKNTWQTVKIRVNFTTSNYKMFRRPRRF